MTSKTLIPSKSIADFIVQFRIQELQNISHKQPLKLSKLDSVFLDYLFNLSNVTRDLRLHDNANHQLNPKLCQRRKNVWTEVWGQP